VGKSGPLGDMARSLINHVIFDLIILIYESISNNRRAKEHPTILITRGITKPLTKKKHRNYLRN
jgi:hypothetical protein